ncbi:hypothetical protein IAE22_31310 [Bacillus sp. S34]|nr:hypothetical protein [Bacillus sp. S34]
MIAIDNTPGASRIESRGGLDPTARVILRAVDHFGAVRSMAIADATGTGAFGKITAGVSVATVVSLPLGALVSSLAPVMTSMSPVRP